MAKKILIVDDEPDLIQVLSARLEAEGYDIVQAFDGQEGLDAAKKESPDLIIMDVMMPKMDGFKVCGLLKVDQRYSRIPIIMLTARARADDKQMSEEIGAEAYINKPFDSQEVIGKVKELLGDE